VRRKDMKHGIAQGSETVSKDKNERSIVKKIEKRREEER
jgi:hypothetical protein